MVLCVKSLECRFESYSTSAKLRARVPEMAEGGLTVSGGRPRWEF